MAIIDFLPHFTLLRFSSHRTAIEEVNFALANLHSLAKHSMERTEPQALEEENYVLLDDDLVDDDDLS
jgi:hypothetical protein